MMYKHNLLFTIIQSYILFQIGNMNISEVDAIELKLDTVKQTIVIDKL